MRWWQWRRGWRLEAMDSEMETETVTQTRPFHTRPDQTRPESRLLPLQTSRRRHDGLVTSRTIKRTQAGTLSPQCISAVTCGVCVIPREFNYFKGAALAAALDRKTQIKPSNVNRFLRYYPRHKWFCRNWFLGLDSTCMCHSMQLP